MLFHGDFSYVGCTCCHILCYQLEGVFVRNLSGENGLLHSGLRSAIRQVLTMDSAIGFRRMRHCRYVHTSGACGNVSQALYQTYWVTEGLTQGMARYKQVTLLYGTMGGGRRVWHSQQVIVNRRKYDDPP